MKRFKFFAPLVVALGIVLTAQAAGAATLDVIYAKNGGWAGHNAGAGVLLHERGVGTKYVQAWVRTYSEDGFGDCSETWVDLQNWSRNGPHVAPYIFINCQGASDLLSAPVLAQYSGFPWNFVDAVFCDYQNGSRSCQGDTGQIPVFGSTYGGKTHAQLRAMTGSNKPYVIQIG